MGPTEADYGNNVSGARPVTPVLGSSLFASSTLPRATERFKHPLLTLSLSLSLLVHLASCRSPRSRGRVRHLSLIALLVSGLPLSSSRPSLCIRRYEANGPPFVLLIFRRVYACARVSYANFVSGGSARRRPHRRDSSMRGTMPCRIASEETNISKRVVVPLCPLSISPCIGNNLSRSGRFRRSRAAQLACMHTVCTTQTFRLPPPANVRFTRRGPREREREKADEFLAGCLRRSEHDGDLCFAVQLSFIETPLSSLLPLLLFVDPCFLTSLALYVLIYIYIARVSPSLVV